MYQCRMASVVRLKNGSRLLPQELVLAASNGNLVPTRVASLELGDWVGLPYGEGHADHDVALPKFHLTPAYGNQQPVRVPVEMDEDLALLLGMYASEGHTSLSNYSIVITNSEEAVLSRCVDLWDVCFNLRARVARPRDRCQSVVVNSKSVVEIMRELECGTRASNKRIPWPIMGSKLGVGQAFIQGLALDAYTSTTQHNAMWAICVDSPQLLDDLQLLLRWWGLRSGRISKYNPKYDKSYEEVFLSGPQAQELLRAVPFLEPSKQASAARLAAMTLDNRRNGADVIPLVHGSVLHALIPKGRGGRAGKGTRTSQWRTLCDPRTVWPSRAMVVRLVEAGFELPRDVRRAIAENLHFSPVANLA